MIDLYGDEKIIVQPACEHKISIKIKPFPNIHLQVNKGIILYEISLEI